MKEVSLLIAAAGLMFSLAGPAAALDNHMKNGKHGPSMLERFDTNKDGVVDRAEMDAGHSAHFSDMDTNGDGSVSRAEMMAYHQKMREERMEKRQAMMFERLDSNGDGVLSEDEIKARGQAMFEELDKDGDGVVTMEERKAARMEKRDHMHKRMNGKHMNDKHMNHDKTDDGTNKHDDGGN